MAESSPFVPFRFKVSIAQGGNTLCQGAFSEVTGIDATMTPKKVSEGGNNYGDVALAGPVTFGTLVLKRGVTSVQDLALWFDAVTNGANSGYRLNGTIEVFDGPISDGKPVLTWTLTGLLPIKFKAPDLSATSSQIAVEELHLAVQTLEFKAGSA